MLELEFQAGNNSGAAEIPIPEVESVISATEAAFEKRSAIAAVKRCDPKIKFNIAFFRSPSGAVAKPAGGGWCFPLRARPLSGDR